MRLPRVQFTIGRLMAVVAGSAFVVTPFAWLPRESRLTFLVGVLTFVSLSSTVASPFLLDWLGGYQKPRPLDRPVIRHHPPARLCQFFVRPVRPHRPGDGSGGS
jgi:hypothetical protein